MTETAEAVTTRVSEIVGHVAAAVTAGGTAEEARKHLADIVKAQGAGGAAAAGAAPIPTVVAGFKIGTKSVTRPNGTEYFVRRLDDHDDVAALREARIAGFPVLAYGPPGTGKTALIEAAYCVDGKRVYTVQGTGDTEVADLVGSFTQLPGGSFVWNDGPMLKAMMEGTVLYVDEIALIDPKVMAVAYGVMDGRGEYEVVQNPERGVVVAEEGFYVASACNPNAPGARLSEAILSRFVFQFEVLTDYKLVKSLGTPTKMVIAAENLQRKYETGEVGWAPQMRECLAFRDIAAKFGEDFALRNLIAAAPEIDRPVVQDVLQKSYGKSIKALVLK